MYVYDAWIGSSDSITEYSCMCVIDLVMSKLLFQVIVHIRGNICMTMNPNVYYGCTCSRLRIDTGGCSVIRATPVFL